MYQHLTTLVAIIFTFSAVHSVHGLSFENLEAISTNPTVQAPSGYYVETKPGGIMIDTVTIRNLGETPMSIRVYATDTTINNQELTVLKAYNDERKDFGTWVRFYDEIEYNLELAALSEKILEFTITVPENTALGEYIGGILVEKLNTSDKEVQENIVIKTNARIGLGAKVVVTDNPQPPEYIKPATPSPNWRQIYFYSSLGIFLVVTFILGANYMKGKKQMKKSHSGGKHHNKRDK